MPLPYPSALARLVIRALVRRTDDAFKKLFTGKPGTLIGDQDWVVLLGG